MNRNRFLFCVAALACVCGNLATAQNMPRYEALEQPELDRGVAVRFRSTPLMMSRFPTAFHIAVSEERQLVRVVDIDGRVRQWSSREPKNSIFVAETQGEPACAELSIDGSLLAWADHDGLVALLAIDSGETRFRENTITQRTVTLRFAPDSKSLASVTVDGTIRVWDTTTGDLLRQLRTKPGAVQTLAFSPDSRRLAVASSADSVTIHEIAASDDSRLDRQGVAVAVSGSRVTACAFTPVADELVVATADGGIQVHDLESGREPIKLETGPFAIWSIAFDPDGNRMAAGNSSGTIQLLETDSWAVIQSVKSHDASVSDIEFAGDLGLISAGLDGRLLFWIPEVRGIPASARIAGRTAPAWVSTFSPNGKKLFVGGEQKRFEIWDLEHNKLLVSRDGPPTTRCAAFSPDGQTLATGGDDKKIRLADVDTGETRAVLSGHLGAVSAVVFHDLGRTLVSGCDRGFVKVWDIASGQAKASWKKHNQQVYCVTFSPDRKWLITGGGHWMTGDPGELIVWEAATGRIHTRLEGHQLAVWAIVFTPDGERFATSDSTGAVKIWNTATFEEERTLQHETWVRALAMSPDGGTLAVGRGDGSIRLWNTSTWTQQASYEDHTSFAFFAQYSPDGTTLATAGQDGTVRFWKHSP